MTRKSIRRNEFISMLDEFKDKKELDNYDMMELCFDYIMNRWGDKK